MAHGAQGHRHDGVRRVVRAGGNEDGAVGHVDVVQAVHPAVGVGHAGGRVVTHHHAAHDVVAGRQAAAVLGGRHRQGQAGSSLGHHVLQLRYPELLGDLLVLAVAPGDLGHRQPEDVLDSWVEGHRVAEVGQVVADDLAAGQPVAQDRGAHEPLEVRAERLGRAEDAEQGLVGLRLGDRVLAAAELHEAAAEVGQAVGLGERPGAGEVRVDGVLRALRDRAAAVGVHALVEEDRGAVDEGVQHQPAAELAATVGEL